MCLLERKKRTQRVTWQEEAAPKNKMLSGFTTKQSGLSDVYSRIVGEPQRDYKYGTPLLRCRIGLAGVP